MAMDDPRPIAKNGDFNAREIFDKVRQTTETHPENGREEYVKMAAMASKTREVLAERKMQLEYELNHISTQLNKFSAVCDLMLKTMENESSN